MVRKFTTANTTYYETSRSDTSSILNQCRDIVEMDNQLKNQTDQELYNIHKKFNTANKQMPGKSASYGGGPNNVRSMCEGVIDNFNDGQYNVSNKTVKGLSEAFRVAASVFETFEEFDFEEVSSLPKSDRMVDGGDVFNSLFGDE